MTLTLNRYEEPFTAQVADAVRPDFALVQSGNAAAAGVADTVRAAPVAAKTMAAELSRVIVLGNFTYASVFLDRQFLPDPACAMWIGIFTGLPGTVNNQFPATGGRCTEALKYRAGGALPHLYWTPDLRVCRAQLTKIRARMTQKGPEISANLESIRGIPALT
ncbi:hypothetical protein [Streptomyces sp. NPDC013181]|uniref:hypothetical protein n=1 Tax=Streptomyces sp. NPDC013181 TaxID=3364864 RepID=UPI003675E822